MSRIPHHKGRGQRHGISRIDGILIDGHLGRRKNFAVLKLRLDREARFIWHDIRDISRETLSRRRHHQNVKACLDVNFNPTGVHQTGHTTWIGTQQHSHHTSP